MKCPLGLHSQALTQVIGSEIVPKTIPTSILTLFPKPSDPLFQGCVKEVGEFSSQFAKGYQSIQASKNHPKNYQVSLTN